MTWLDEAYPNHVCALQGFRIPCRGRLTLHHLISHGDARGNEEIEALLECNPPELTEFVCEAHHTNERWADSKAGQRILWRRKAEQFGEAWMRYVIDGLPWKHAYPEMRWEALRDG